MRARACAAAICIIVAFVAESALRLAFLAPFYGLASVPLHGAAVVLCVAVSGWLLIRVRGRPRAQFFAAFLLATCWVLLMVFDVIAFVTAPRLHQAMSLALVAEFYCSGAITRCSVEQPGTVLLLGAIAVALALLIWSCADAIADLARRVTVRADRALRPCMLSLRLLMALLAAVYAAGWMLFPAKSAQREPLVSFLAPVEFRAGPLQLLNARPDYRVEPTPGAKPRTLVLITVDSLRADAVELEPGRPTLTPFLRSVASTGKLHDLGPATAVCANSYCGIVSLQSGSDWAAMQNGPPLMLADVLAANGYRSHFILSGPHRKDLNLAELYGPHLVTFLDDSSADSTGLADDREQVRRLTSIAIHDPDRSYLSIHLMSAHSAGLRFTSASDKANVWQALFGGGSASDYAAFYRRGVRQADWIISQLFAVLERRGLLADALVIITADHGERIAPGRRPGHGVPLDPDIAAIPLLVYDSRGARWPRQTNASQIDIAPTLLQAAGIEKPAQWRGHSLQQRVNRLAAPLDTLHASALVGSVAGRRILLRCATSTGHMAVLPMDNRGITSGLHTAAIASAPRLHRGLAARRDAEQCFR